MIGMDEGIKHKFADIASMIGNAPILAIPVFLIVNFTVLEGMNYIIITSLCILFCTILPIVGIVLPRKILKKEKGKRLHYEIPDRKERITPLIIGITSYFIGVIILYFFHAPLITVALMFFYFSDTSVVFLINLFWKISIHAVGLTGPTSVLIYVFGPFGGILSFFLPIIMWSRVYLKKHTMAQVIAGSLLGYIITIIQIWIIFDYINNIKVNLEIFYWIIPAFTITAIILSLSGFINRKKEANIIIKLLFLVLSFLFIAIYVLFAPFQILIIFLAVSIIYLSISIFSGKGFLWFDGISIKTR
jgi:membrane-associated phospholipid phosphatase